MKNKINTIYKDAERFAEITKRAIISGNIKRAKKCLSIAEQLLETGSNETKSVISNVYVFSVSTFMELRHCNISNLFPTGLKTEYIKQINATSV
ncbi:DUF7674 family protein [Flavobacterium sp.]|uniref:DUF7674 family protein n=1 Tax=Flavobacterium sp. TaxID=239 RepID=UPI003D6B778B